MPAWSARSNRGFPAWLAGLGSFPKGEISDVVLAVFVGLDPLADSHPFGVEAGQFAVGRRRGYPKKDRAVAGAIGVATLEQLDDHFDHLGNVLGRLRHHVRQSHAECGHVGQKELLVTLRDQAD